MKTENIKIVHICHLIGYGKVRKNLVRNDRVRELVVVPALHQEDDLDVLGPRLGGRSRAG